MADQYALLRYNFYIPVLVLLAVGAPGLLALPLRFRFRWPCSVLFAIACLYAYRGEQPNLLALDKKNDQPRHLRVISYNVQAYHQDEEAILSTISGADADVVCLVEGTFGGHAPDKAVRRLGPDYGWAVGSRLSIASRFPIIEEREILKTGDVRVLRVVIDCDNELLAIMAIDIDPPLRRQDASAFRDLRGLLQTEELAAIVIGDFNIPRGSHHLRHATESWSDAFLLSRDQRYLGTWPTTPFPFWQIDHAFVRGDLEVTRAIIGTAKASDHFPLIVDLRLREGRAETTE